MAKSYYAAHYSLLETLSALNDEEFGRLMRAIIYYAKTGQEVELPGMERLLFPTLKFLADQEKETYDEICRNNKKASALGVAARRKKREEAEAEEAAAGFKMSIFPDE